MIAALLFAGAAHAGGMMGVEYVPPGLGDLAWAQQGQLSGTLVGENDGLLVPPLTAVGGYAWDRVGVFGGLTLARVSTTVIQSDSQAQSLRSAIRPSAEVRYWLVEPSGPRPNLCISAGAFAVIPAVKEVSDAADDEESQALQEAADEAAGRIGAIGGSLGLGAEVRWETGLGLGIRSDVVVTRFDTSNAQTQTVSSLVQARTALALSYWF